MNKKILSSEDEVRKFLQELKGTLTDPGFNVNNDLDILLRKKGESPKDPFTTVNTLLKLDFDKNDVITQLLSLDVSDYKETLINDKNSSLPLFYAFGKVIKNTEVYIKVKIRDKINHKVFCISFCTISFTNKTTICLIPA